MSKWNFDFDDKALKELKKLDHSIQDKIFKFLDRLVANYSSPRAIGDALQGEFKGFWRYRVGDYRIICDLQDRELLILALRVAHRKEAYETFKVYNA